MKFRRWPGLFRGTVLLLICSGVIVLMDQVGLIDPEWLGTPVRVMQAVRVLLVASVLLGAVRPLAGFLTRRYGNHWQWLVLRRWRLLFWYLVIEALLFQGTFG